MFRIIDVTLTDCHLLKGLCFIYLIIIIITIVPNSMHIFIVLLF